MNKHKGSALEEWLKEEGLEDLIENPIDTHRGVMSLRRALLQLLTERLSSAWR
jgi:hypothetical protein